MDWNRMYKRVTTENRCTEEYLDSLSKAISKKSVVLCIGAGITAPIIGTWKQLLNQLAVIRCCDCAGDEIPDSIQLDVMSDFINGRVKDGFFVPNSVNALEQGEYLMYDPTDPTALSNGIRDQYWREKFFAAQVRESIQRLIKHNIKMEPVEYFKRWLSHDPSCSINISTLAGVVELCIRKGIQEIITYNFDTILDDILRDKEVWKEYGMQKKQKNVEVYSFHTHPSKTDVGHIKPSSKNGTIRIYHVHGILSTSENNVSPIIFSENSYLIYQDKLLNWSNIRISDAMYRSTLLCVGFSGTDPNFRLLCRLFADCCANPIIENSAEKHNIYLMRAYDSDVNRFIPKKKDDKGRETDELDYPSSDQDIVCTYLCVKTYMDAIQNYFIHQLGTKILWFQTYDDIAGELAALAKK